MSALIEEIKEAMSVNDEQMLACDVFNTANFKKLTEEEKVRKITCLSNFYGSDQSSKFNGVINKAPALFNNNEIEDQLTFFFEDFTLAVTKAEEIRNNDIQQMVKDGKLSKTGIDNYKDEHPIPPDDIYSTLVETRGQYPEVMQVFKLSLLIPPSTANVERGFSVLNLIHTKQRNRLTVKALDRLMRIVLIGPGKLTESQYEVLVDKYKDMSDRRIEL